MSEYVIYDLESYPNIFTYCEYRDWETIFVCMKSLIERTKPKNCCKN